MGLASIIKPKCYCLKIMKKQNQDLTWIQLFTLLLRNNTNNQICNRQVIKIIQFTKEDSGYVTQPRILYGQRNSWKIETS